MKQEKKYVLYEDSFEIFGIYDTEEQAQQVAKDIGFREEDIVEANYFPTMH